MIRFYPIVVLLQFFCLYHAYSNKQEQKWYWIIILFPFIGSIFYLYKHFYSRDAIDDVAEGVKSTFVTNYTLEKLEKELAVSDTVRNRMALADEHAKYKNYDRALELYASCLKGIYKNDPKLLLKLLQVSHALGDHAATIHYGDQLEGNKTFASSLARVDYAWSLYQQDLIEEAESEFKAMDVRYGNYRHRLEFADFLKKTNNIEDSRELLEELLDEIDSMDRHEKRMKKEVHEDIKYYYGQLNT